MFCYMNCLSRQKKLNVLTQGLSSGELELLTFQTKTSRLKGREVFFVYLGHLQIKQTSQGYIIRILQHAATKLRNITNFVMLFQAVIKFLSRLVQIKIFVIRGKVHSQVVIDVLRLGDLAKIQPKQKLLDVINS